MRDTAAPTPPLLSPALPRVALVDLPSGFRRRQRRRLSPAPTHNATPAMAHPPGSPGRLYEGWTLKELKEEARRLRATAFSSQEINRTDHLPPPTGPDCALEQRRPPRRYFRTAPSSLDSASALDLQDYPHHLGKRLEEVLTSLRDVSIRLLKDEDESQVSEIVDAAFNIVTSFCDAIRLPEAFKATAIAESAKSPVPRIDPEYNLLYLQFKSALEVRGENHDILLCFDDYARCPLSCRDVAKILQPVRSITCGHIYERSDIMMYTGCHLKECPVSGCPGVVSKDLVFEDAELRRDILAAAEEKRNGRWVQGRRHLKGLDIV